jgi:hypothetical protein
MSPKGTVLQQQPVTSEQVRWLVLGPEKQQIFPLTPGSESSIVDPQRNYDPANLIVTATDHQHIVLYGMLFATEDPVSAPVLTSHEPTATLIVSRLGGI